MTNTKPSKAILKASSVACDCTVSQGCVVYDAMTPYDTIIYYTSPRPSLPPEKGSITSRGIANHHLRTVLLSLWTGAAAATLVVSGDGMCHYRVTGRTVFLLPWT